VISAKKIHIRFLVERKETVQVLGFGQTSAYSLRPPRSVDAIKRSARRIENEIHKCIHEKEFMSLERVNRSEVKSVNLAGETFAAATASMADHFRNQIIEQFRMMRIFRSREVLKNPDTASDYSRVPWRIAIKRQTLDSISNASDECDRGFICQVLRYFVEPVRVSLIGREMRQVSERLVPESRECFFQISDRRGIESCDHRRVYVCSLVSPLTLRMT
jgi:hypothetical protein